MDALRRNVVAITAGVLYSVLVAGLISGTEVYRSVRIARFYGHSYGGTIVIFVLVVTATFLFAAITLVSLSLLRGLAAKTLVAIGAQFLSVFACLPVYWYVYRDAPRGWHINIADEYLWSQPAGVAAAIFIYAVSCFAARLSR